MIALAGFQGSQTAAGIGGFTLLIWAAIAIGLVAGVPLTPPGRAAKLALASVGVLVGLSAASGGWTDDDGSVFVDAVRLLGYLGGLSIVIFAIRRGEGRHLLVGLALGLAAIALLALSARFFPWLLDGDRQSLLELPSAAGRLSYPIGYWNGLGAMMAAGVVLCGWLASAARGRRTRALSVAALPLFVVAIYLSGSRGAVLATLLGATVLVALSPVKPRMLAGLSLGLGPGLAVVAVVSTMDGLLLGATTAEAERQGALAGLALVAAAVVAGAARVRIDRLLELPELPTWLGARRLALLGAALAVGLFAFAGGAERIGSFSDPDVEADIGEADRTARFFAAESNARVQLWQTALEAFSDEPLHGVGSGSYRYYWNANGTLDRPVRDAHSAWLELLAELGPLGLLALVGLVGAGIREATRRTFGDADGVVAAAAGVMAVALVALTVDWSFEIPAVAALLIVAIGVLTGPATRGASAGAAARVPGKATRLIGLTAAAAAVLIAGSLALSERSLIESRALTADGKLAAAAAAADEAADLQPLSARPWLQLGSVLSLAGDLEGAARALEQAVELAPRDPRGNQALALVYQALGDSRFEPLIERAFELYPADR